MAPRESLQKMTVTELRQFLDKNGVDPNDVAASEGRSRPRRADFLNAAEELSEEMDSSTKKRRTSILVRSRPRARESNPKVVKNDRPSSKSPRNVSAAAVIGTSTAQKKEALRQELRKKLKAEIQDDLDRLGVSYNSKHSKRELIDFVVDSTWGPRTTRRSSIRSEPQVVVLDDDEPAVQESTTTAQPPVDSSSETTERAAVAMAVEKVAAWLQSRLHVLKIVLLIVIVLVVIYTMVRTLDSLYGRELLHTTRRHVDTLQSQLAGSWRYTAKKFSYPHRTQTSVPTS